VTAETCTYCDANIADSVDHVPPRSLFPEPRPNNLITVPACSACNKGASLDDEYFRVTIATRLDTSFHPAASQLQPSVSRGLARPESARFLQSLLSRIRASVPQLPIDQQPALVMDVDITRLNRVASRIIRGLWRHEVGSRLPLTVYAHGLLIDGFQSADGSLDAAVPGMLQLAQAGESRSRGSDVIAYWYKRVVDQPHTSVWALRFFGRVWFLGLTTRERPSFLLS
jgi:hypothetical protein